MRENIEGEKKNNSLRSLLDRRSFSRDSFDLISASQRQPNGAFEMQKSKAARMIFAGKKGPGETNLQDFPKCKKTAIEMGDRAMSLDKTVWSGTEYSNDLSRITALTLIR